MFVCADLNVYVCLCVFVYLCVSACMFVCVRVYYCCACVWGSWDFQVGSASHAELLAVFLGSALAGSKTRTSAHPTASLLGYLFITRHVPQMIGGEELG